MTTSSHSSFLSSHTGVSFLFYGFPAALGFTILLTQGVPGPAIAVWAVLFAAAAAIFAYPMAALFRFAFGPRVAPSVSDKGIALALLAVWYACTTLHFLAPITA